jgi:hypothetical protein
MAAFDSLQLLVDLDASGLETKINSTVTSITDALGKFENLDFSKLMSSLDSVNWTSIVGKLFSPANLIAFFSALAATGVIAGMAAQQAGATAATTAGLTTGLTGVGVGSTITTDALTAQNTLGGLAGSTTDVASALADMTAYISNFGGTATDATTIITAMGQALAATGGNFSTAFAPLMQLIQNSGAETPAQIEELISNVMSSSQASGGTLSMADVASQTSDFALAAQKAHVSFDGINTSIVTFGKEANINLSGAQADMKLLTSEVNGSTSGVEAMAQQGTNFNTVVSGLNTNASKVFSDMNTALAKMPIPMLDTLAGALGIPTPAAQAAVQLAKWGPAIDIATASMVTLSGPTALAKINTQFQDSLTLADALKIDWQNIQDDLASIWNASPGGFLTALIALGGLSFAALSAVVPSLLKMIGSGIAAGIPGATVPVATEGAGVAASTISIAGVVTTVLGILGVTAGAIAELALLAQGIKNFATITEPNSTAQTAPGVPSGFTVTFKNAPAGTTATANGSATPMSVSGIANFVSSNQTVSN